MGHDGTREERQGLVSPDMAKAIVRLIGLGIAMTAVVLTASAGVRPV